MAFIPHLKELITIPSLSGNEGAIVTYLTKVCDKAGARVTRVGKDNIAAYFPGKGSGKALLLNGHMDTIAPDNKWTYNPFDLQADPDNIDRVIGLGTSDMKAGLAVMLYVAERAKGTELPYDIWLLFSAREEVDNPGAVQLTEWFAREVRDRYSTIGGLILEPTNSNFVGVGHRGDTRWDIVANGPGGHASQTFEGAAPAIEKISRMIAHLPQLRQEWMESYSDDLLGSPTINPTLISAGQTVNVVPREATTTLDLRVTPRLAGELSSIRSSIEHTFDISITQRWEPSPTLVESDEYIYKIMHDILPQRPFKAFPGATDQFAFLAHGIPMLTYGPGDIEAMHQPNEWVSLSSISRSIGVIERLIAAY